MLVPDDSHSLFPTSTRPGAPLAQLGTRAFILVDGEPLRVYEPTEIAPTDGGGGGGAVVAGSVQAEVGEEFEVVFYEGRDGESRGRKSGYEVKVYFGKKYVGGLHLKYSAIKARRELDSGHQRRFWVFDDVRINAIHVRKFRFSPVATTDNLDEACSDLDFLNNISTVTVEYSRIKHAPHSKKSEGEKEKAKEQEGREDTPAYDPGEEVDERKLSEESNKGKFAIDPGFGDPVVSVQKPSSGKSSRYKYVYVDEDKVDLQFVFRIRSQAYIEHLLRADASSPSPLPSRAPTPPVELTSNVLLLDFDDAEVAAEAAAMGVEVPKKPSADDDEEMDSEEDELEDSDVGDSDGERHGERDKNEDKDKEEDASTARPKKMKHRVSYIFAAAMHDSVKARGAGSLVYAPEEVSTVWHTKQNEAASASGKDKRDQPVDVVPAADAVNPHFTPAPFKPDPSTISYRPPIYYSSSFTSSAIPATSAAAGPSRAHLAASSIGSSSVPRTTQSSNSNAGASVALFSSTNSPAVTFPSAVPRVPKPPVSFTHPSMRAPRPSSTAPSAVPSTVGGVSVAPMAPYKAPRLAEHPPYAAADSSVPVQQQLQPRQQQPETITLSSDDDKEENGEPPSGGGGSGVFLGLGAAAAALFASSTAVNAQRVGRADNFWHTASDTVLDVTVSNGLTSCEGVNIDWSSPLFERRGVTFTLTAHAVWADTDETKYASEQTVMMDQPFQTPASSVDWTVDYPAGTRLQFFLEGEEMGGEQRFYGNTSSFIVGEGDSSCVPEIHKPVTIQWPDRLTTCGTAAVRWRGGDLPYVLQSNGGQGSQYFGRFHSIDSMANNETGTIAIGYYDEHYPKGAMVSLRVMSNYHTLLASRHYHIRSRGSNSCSVGKEYVHHPWSGRPFVLVLIIVGSIIGALVLLIVAFFVYRFAMYKIEEKRGIKLADSPPTSPVQEHDVPHV